MSTISLRKGPPVPSLQEMIPHHVLMEANEHPGKWVAVAYEVGIVAIGESSSEVEAAARAAGHAEPLVYRVPEPGVVYLYPVDGVWP